MTDMAAPRRIRFSLANLLLLTTVVALSIVLWKLSTELVPLRAEVLMLRNETGRLVVEDETKIHAIRVATTKPDTWRYRVWVPENTRLWLRVEYSAVPKSDVPIGTRSGGSSLMEPGEHLIDVQIEESESRADELVARILVDGSHRTSPQLREAEHDWIVHDQLGGRHASWSGAEVKAQSVATGEPMVLLRYRPMEVDNIQRDAEGNVRGYSHKDIEEPCEGLLLWIDDNSG